MIARAFSVCPFMPCASPSTPSSAKWRWEFSRRSVNPLILRRRTVQENTRQSFYGIENGPCVTAGPRLGHKCQRIFEIACQIFLPTEKCRRRRIQRTLDGSLRSSSEAWPRRPSERLRRRTADQGLRAPRYLNQDFVEVDSPAPIQSRITSSLSHAAEHRVAIRSGSSSKARCNAASAERVPRLKYEAVPAQLRRSRPGTSSPKGLGTGGVHIGSFTIDPYDRANIRIGKALPHPFRPPNQLRRIPPAHSARRFHGKSAAFASELSIRIDEGHTVPDSILA